MTYILYYNIELNKSILYVFLCLYKLYMYMMYVYVYYIHSYDNTPQYDMYIIYIL